jgi:hypothetical protein
MQDEPKVSLVIQHQVQLGNEPFETDLLSRKDLAERLTGYVGQSSAGCVIGITAPWGDGKTWFGKNWEAQLKKAEHKTLFLDVFKSDFGDDAFTAIAAEILRGIAGDAPTATKFLEKTKKIGAALLPAIAKVAIAAGTKVVTGLTPDQIDKVVEDAGASAAEAAEKYVEKRILEHQKNLEAIAGFQKVLAGYCGKQDKPVVFFIDELDRCRPNYAVKVIEHIKHFFDVPNLVFVLLVNREQLEKSIQGVYGSSIDAASYLSKFVHFFLSLPTAQNKSVNSANDLKRFCRKIATLHGYPSHQYVEQFIDALILIAPFFELSLRDIERAFIHFRLASAVQRSSHLLAYVIALKLKHGTIFQMFQSNYVQGSKEASGLLTELGRNNTLPNLLKALELQHANDAGFDNTLSPEDSALVASFFNASLTASGGSALQMLINAIDLPQL